MSCGGVAAAGCWRVVRGADTPVSYRSHSQSPQTHHHTLVISYFSRQRCPHRTTAHSYCLALCAGIRCDCRWQGPSGAGGAVHEDREQQGARGRRPEVRRVASRCVVSVGVGVDVDVDVVVTPVSWCSVLPCCGSLVFDVAVCSHACCRRCCNPWRTS